MYGLVLLLTLVDHASKLIVKANLALGESVPIIGNFLRLTLVLNEGGAFSTQLGSSLFYAIVSSLITIILLVVIYRRAVGERLASLALALICAGALGNLVDRLHLGSVIDWIDVEFFDIHLAAGKILFWEHSGYHLTRWPVFNVADAAVTVGILFLIVNVLCQRRKAGDADPQITG